MLARFQKLVAFLKEVFSEEGRGSFARVIQGFIVLMTCGWVSYVVLRTRAIPDLSGPSMFVGAGSLHYMTGKAAGIVAAFKSPADKNTENGQNGQ